MEKDDDGGYSVPLGLKDVAHNDWKKYPAMTFQNILRKRENPETIKIDFPNRLTEDFFYKQGLKR